MNNNYFVLFLFNEFKKIKISKKEFLFIFDGSETNFY